jgi:hypothetical protein
MGLFKPKSEDEIRKGIRDIKIPSYKLTSFFNVLNWRDANKLKFCCRELEVEIEDMEATHILKLPVNFMPPYIVWKKAPTDYSLIEKESVDKNKFHLSRKHKLIRFGYDNYDAYIIFHKDKIKEIIISLIYK